MDDTVRGAAPPGVRRATLQIARRLPARTRSRSERSGTKVEKTGRPSACKSAESTVPATSFLFLRYLSGDRFEGPAYFLEQDRKLNFQDRFLRIDHHVHCAFQNRPMLPDCFPQTPLDAIAFDCASENASDGESSACAPLRLPQIKNGHVRGKVTASLLVDALEVGVFQQPGRPRKCHPLARCGLLYRPDCTPVRSVCVHELTILNK